MGKMRNIPGGHHRPANRWYDAGYADKAPHAASMIYGFLNRWADNETGIVEQTIGAITRHSGVRTERMARKHLAGLELWGVISKLPKAYQNSPNRWRVENLEKRAPAYPTDEAIEAYRRSTPTPREGANEANAPAPGEGAPTSGNGQGWSNPGPAHTPSAPSPSVPTPSAPTPGDTALGGTPYQAMQDQAIGDEAIGDHAMPIIACSGAKAPTHPAQPSADARARHDFAEERATNTERVGAPDSVMFQDWWQSYPGVGDWEDSEWEDFYRDACVAWNEIEPDRDLAYQIFIAITEQAQWTEDQHPDGKGFPEPAKWLRDGRWQDEALGGWTDEDDDDGLEGWNGEPPF